jgi:uncharacterized protein (TIGR03086 family)
MTVATGMLEQAVAAFQSHAREVRDEQWPASTPCTEWDVRALVNHVVGELRWIPPMLQGKAIADVGDELNGDLLGDDPQAAWEGAAKAALDAASQPGVEQRIVHLSYGDRSAGDYLGEVASDIVVHSWDLARGIGADDRLDPALVDFAQATLAPQIEAARGAGFFAPEVAVPPDADAQTRLLALTGRKRD